MHFDKYYEVFDWRKKLVFSTVYLHLAEGYVKEKFEETGVIYTIEEVSR